VFFYSFTTSQVLKEFFMSIHRKVLIFSLSLVVLTAVPLLIFSLWSSRLTIMQNTYLAIQDLQEQINKNLEVKLRDVEAITQRISKNPQLQILLDQDILLRPETDHDSRKTLQRILDEISTVKPDIQLQIFDTRKDNIYEKSDFQILASHGQAMMHQPHLLMQEPVYAHLMDKGLNLILGNTASGNWNCDGPKVLLLRRLDGGVLACCIQEETIYDIYQQSRILDMGNLYLITNTGDLLSTSRRESCIQSAPPLPISYFKSNPLLEGEARQIDIDSKKYMLMNLEEKHYHYQLYTLLERDLVLEDFRILQNKLILTFIGILGLLSFSLTLFTEQLLKPVKKLSGLLKRWTEYKQADIGPLSEEKPKVLEEIRKILGATSKKADEVGNLSHTFLILLETQKDFDKKMEERVWMRTRELTETLENLKATQNQLIHSEKLVAISSMVTGVAHEINTPIGVALTGVSYLQEVGEMLESSLEKECMSQEELLSHVQMIKKSSQIILTSLEKAGDLIQSFKQVSVNQGTGQAMFFSIREVIEKVLASYRHRLERRKVEAVLEASEYLEIQSYSGSVIQILSILIENSLQHAFPEEETEEKGHIRIKLKDLGEKVLLEYSDDGCGIPLTEQRRVFDAFYTTDRVHGSSGLGLFILYQVVEEVLEGSLEWSSVIDNGVEFRIILPKSIL
jgi:signal transduction histidine kinase